MHRNSSQILELIEKAWEARRGTNNEKAETLLIQAVNISRRENNARCLILALSKLGQLKRDDRNNNNALPLYKEAESICRRINEKLLLAKVLKHLGEIYLENRQLKLSRKYLEEAIKIYEAEPIVSELDFANTFRVMGILFSELNNFSSSKMYWQKAHDLYKKNGVKAGVRECIVHLS